MAEDCDYLSANLETKKGKDLEKNTHNLVSVLFFLLTVLYILFKVANHRVVYVKMDNVFYIL